MSADSSLHYPRPHAGCRSGVSRTVNARAVRPGSSVRCRLWLFGLCWSRATDRDLNHDIPTVAELLSDIGIQRELGGLPGWSRRGNSLTKTYRFPTFPASITFVTRVADLAESMDHHPDIDIRHTRLTFTLSTHDAGGITANDLQLAREIERLATESGV